MTDKKINLFNNPMVDSALKSLTPEQKKEYEEIGKYMFETTNFSVDNTKPNPEQEIAEALLYITSAVKSGLHPSELSPKELEILYGVLGDNWYEEYGYTKDEVPPNPRIGVQLTNQPVQTADRKKRASKKERIEKLRQKLRETRAIH